MHYQEVETITKNSVQFYRFKLYELYGVDSYLDKVPSIGLFILHFLAIFLTNIANGRIRGSFNFGLTAEYAFNSHVFLFSSFQNRN